jgi:hypothetical protein
VRWGLGYVAAAHCLAGGPQELAGNPASTIDQTQHGYRVSVLGIAINDDVRRNDTDTDIAPKCWTWRTAFRISLKAVVEFIEQAAEFKGRQPANLKDVCA